MAKTKKFLRKTASQKENKEALEGQVGRDHSALIVPITIIKTEVNIRRKLTHIDELAESIKAHGVLQALVVTKGWRLISGHRRLEAAKRAGLAEVPVRLADIDDNASAVVKVIENIQRENLSGIEEVHAVAALLPIFDGNQSALARTLGKSRTYINQCCRGIEVVKKLGCSTSNSLSKSMLFELANAKNPEELIEQIEKGEAKTIKDIREGKKDRKPSGGLGGGRYVQQAIKLTKTKSGWSLSVNYAADRTPNDSKRRIISTLEELLRQLREGD